MSHMEKLLKVTTEGELLRAMRMTGQAPVKLESVGPELAFDLLRIFDAKFEKQVTAIGLDDVDVLSHGVRARARSIADAIFDARALSADILHGDGGTNTAVRVTASLGDIDALVDAIAEMDERDITAEYPTAFVAHCATTSVERATAAIDTMLESLSAKFDLTRGPAHLAGAEVTFNLTVPESMVRDVQGLPEGAVLASTTLRIAHEPVRVTIYVDAAATRFTAAGATTQTDEEDNATPRESELVLRLERRDGLPFTDRDLQDPLETALVALQGHLGTLTIVDGRTGERPSVRLVTLRGVFNDVPLFKGTLMFPCGPVHASLTNQ
jgi:hypothetical protein